MRTICATHVLKDGTIHWSMVDLPGTVLLGETDSPFLQSYQLCTASWLGWRLKHSSCLHNRLPIGAILCSSYAGNHSFCEFLRATI